LWYLPRGSAARRCKLLLTFLLDLVYTVERQPESEFFSRWRTLVITSSD
jgi:hypothetical protein